MENWRFPVDEDEGVELAVTVEVPVPVEVAVEVPVPKVGNGVMTGVLVALDVAEGVP